MAPFGREGNLPKIMGEPLEESGPTQDLQALYPKLPAHQERR